MSLRVRFAPSPTGRMHIGNFRDALFKFLFARHHGGVNILRIEDTDRGRYSPEAEQELIETLAWAGIEFDEGPHIGGPHEPYHQSQRKEKGIYDKYIQLLLDKGAAYKAFDTPEELDRMRKYQEINRLQTGYFGGTWRDATPAQVARAEAESKPYVIRQRIPRDTTIAIEDAIRGRIEWDSNTVDDPVLIKGDGMPTYHFAAMVDDHLMGITHIMRGEEWISSAPKHAALFDAFGWQRPVFVHCPVIKGKSGKKLSKREGATSVLDYRDMGFLADALVNFVALIGWSPGGDLELMSRAQMIEHFDISGLQPSSGVWDYDKLKWFSGHTIRALDPEALLGMIIEYVGRPETLAFWKALAHDPEASQLTSSDPMAVHDSLVLLKHAIEEDPAYALEAIKLEQPRVVTLADFGEACAFFFLDEPPMDERAVAKWLSQPYVPELFDYLISGLSDQGSGLSAQNCEALVRSFAESHGMEKLGPVVHPVRVALTGKTAGPGLFELMSVLGPPRIAKRLGAALTGLAK
ncbi:MAG: glutamate--tRNA ligase [Fimbriimonadales bacterium]